ncbi:MAG: hypothetical protein H3C62_04820 [Gemmatimonadaceae bacterium]|nr:hypothetical protein [Gemmatimonadaceae bacterium]
MRLVLGLLLGLTAGYAYGFYDGRHHTQPTVLQLIKKANPPRVNAVQRAESLKTDAERKLQQNADDKLKAAH